MKTISHKFLGDMQQIMRLCIQCTVLGQYDCWCYWSGHVNKFEVSIREAPFEYGKPDIFCTYVYLDGVYKEREAVIESRFDCMIKELQMRIEQSEVE